tara:strand:+ start:87 stop:1301 length:1215 start_codon:yes stop_codon:yes gene_type:complete
MTTYTPQSIKTFYGPRLRKAVNNETQKIQSSFTSVDTDKLSTSDFGTHFQNHSAVGFDSHIKPTSAAVDLGTSTSNWRHIYASGTIHVGSKSFGEVGNAIDTGTDNFATTDLTVRGNLNVQGSTVTVDTALVQLQNGFVFEGSTPDDYETTMTATNPTQDNTITIPNESGNIVLTESAGAVQTNTIANSAVTNDKIADTSIRAAKLNLGSDTVSVNTLSATNVNATDFTGNITGVVQTAAQPNITSLGTLTALNVDNLTFDGNTIGSSSTNIAFSKPLNVSGAITCTTLTQTNASGSLSDDKGEIRSVPGNTQTTAYTLVLTDHGKHINTNAQVTVPANVFSAGHSITIANTSNAGINLIQGSGLTLRNAGQTTTGDRVINNYGLVTVFFTSATEAYASGSGLA